MVERWSPKPNVEGSSPSVPALYRKAAIKLIAAFFNGKTGTDVVHFTVPAYPVQRLENKRRMPVGYAPMSSERKFSQLLCAGEAHSRPGRVPGNQKIP